MIRRRIAGAGPIALGLLALLGPDRAEGQVAFAPGIGTIPDGVGMTAVPAVSADRRYVRLSVNAGFQTVDGFTNVGIPFGVSGLGSGAGGLGALGNPGGPARGGAGGVAGAPMGMNGPATGPSPAASELAFGRPNPTAPVPVPAGDALSSSFDHSFRMAPAAGPARPSPRAARASRSTRKKPSGR